MGSSAIDQAFILGAGLGSRMRPLTDNLPKPMVPLAGKPLIDHVIERLRTAGVKKIVVNVHYFADQLEAHLKRGDSADIIISSERDTLLDTGGGAAKALRFFGDKPFFIHNADSVWIEHETDNLKAMKDIYDAEKMDALLLLADRNTSLGYDGKGDFFISPDDRLKRRSGDKPSDYVFAGASIAHPRMFEDHPLGPFSLNLLWDKSITAQRVFGLKHTGIWMHVGTTEALRDAEHCLKQNALSL